MRVLITGCGGMLGSAVYPAFLAAENEVFATDLVPCFDQGLPMYSLDVRDYQAVLGTVLNFEADLILHLAAETDLETCEIKAPDAWLTNAVGTQNVALVAAAYDIPLVYISTAGVFDGRQGTYDEFDQPNPINVYGRSKYEGEKAVARLPRHFIVRAGWMIGGYERDHKFVSLIRDQLVAGAKVIRAVDDKRGTPTYVSDFALNLLELVQTPYYGLYHMTGHGWGTRFHVAQAIVDALGYDDVEVAPVKSDVFQEYFAPRPDSEVLLNHMLGLRGLDRMRPWREALRDYLGENQ